MQKALDHFRTSIGRVRDLVAIHNSVKAQSTSALDLSDILRASLVLAVSALDYYVHEVVTLGILEIHRGDRSEPNSVNKGSQQSAFSRFEVSLGAARQERLMALDVASWLEDELQQNQGFAPSQQSPTVSALISTISTCILNRLNNTSWLEDEIRERLGFKSFQQPDKIAEVIKLISSRKLWDEVACSLNKDTKDVKQQLSAIVDRRNKIAHEADIDPSFGVGDLWSIDEVMVGEVINFIEHVVEAIHKLLIDE